MRIYLAALSAVALLIAPLGAFAGDEREFETNLSPQQEVTGDPGEEVDAEVFSDASGKGMLEFDKRHTSAEVELKLRGASGVQAIHIHCGAAGLNGPVVVALFGGAPVDVDGRFLDLEISNADITPDNCAGDGTRVDNIASLYAAAAKGLLYFNVHTTTYPSGELRG